MAERKRHLARRGGRTACGIPRASASVTNSPALVTCMRCQGTVRMADAEILWSRMGKHHTRRNRQ